MSIYYHFIDTASEVVTGRLHEQKEPIMKMVIVKIVYVTHTLSALVAMVMFPVIWVGTNPGNSVLKVNELSEDSKGATDKYLYIPILYREREWRVMNW